MKKVRPALGLPVLAFLAVALAADEDRAPHHVFPSPRSSGEGELAFSSSNVQLLGWLPLADLSGAATSGNDCWGYASPSGREYALIGTSNGTAWVEVTDPGAPALVAFHTGPSSLWRDMKTYGDNAYVVSEGGSGIQVFDMSSIDSGTVSFLGTVTTGGCTTASHNIVIDETSGFLYRAGGGSSPCSGAPQGLVIYDLNPNPNSPSFAALWSTRYVHDAQVVVSTRPGPLLGAQLAFCAADDGSGGGTANLHILNVTNKASITTVATAAYTSNAFSHQVWLTPDQRYAYLNDELDESSFGFTTRTRIFDVSNPAAPSFLGFFTSGVNAIDHNLYVTGDKIFEANYRSGLRVFDNTTPTAPTVFGFFDTYEADDGAEFNGLWSNYPFLPSGTVIGSDLERGLFVWRLGAPKLTLGFPGGNPDFLDPSGVTLQFDVSESAPGDLQSGTVEFHYGTGGAFTTVAATFLGGSSYEASLPAVPCATPLEYYVSARSTDGITWTDPPAAPTQVHGAVAALGETLVLEDDMEVNAGWTVNLAADLAGLGYATAPTGIWERVDPNGTAAQPEDDHTPAPGTRCWVTGQGSVGGSLGENDVDGGATSLRSPSLDASGLADPYVSYWRWYSNNANGAVNDTMRIDISNNGGSTWSNLETLGPADSDSVGGWILHTARIADFLAPTSTLRIRLVVHDLLSGSIVEAGIDDLRLIDYACGPDCDSDGIPDGQEPDCDLDGLPDDCEVDCNTNGTPDDCEALPDCNFNGTPDVCESITDCNANGIPDECEPDCDLDGIPDGCEPDCDSDGVPDACETDCNANGTPDDCESFADCNANGIPDGCEPDCDSDGLPDACETDCNANGTPDDCEAFADCNANGIPDGCEPDCDSDGVPDACETDCNANGTPDDCEAFADCNANGIPDGCEPDCDSDGLPDACETDCNANGTPDDCEAFADCNANGIPDGCEPDCDSDGVPDACETDCNANGTPDDCEAFADCNANGIPDGCEPDCDSDGLPDACEADCNANGTPDACEAFADCNANGIPDGCEPDCDSDGLPDACEADCNANGTPDACEAFADCNANGIPDGCEPDCDSDGLPDACETDCNANGTPDDCESFADCNANGIPDGCEPDCDSDGVPDACEADCNANGTPDACEAFADCNANGIPDGCEPDCDSDGLPDACEADCNANGTPDDCESFADCNANGIPDGCEPDCDSDGVPDACETDCNANGTPDDCEAFADCNANGIPDGCEPDCDSDGVPDACETDCNANGTPDDCESFADCNANGIPDGCEPDCDSDGLPDACETDCNANGTPDDCEAFADCNANGIPDGCEPDCDSDGVPDACETDCNANGTPDDCEAFADCNANGVPDECDADRNANGIPDDCEVVWKGSTRVSPAGPPLGPASGSWPGSGVSGDEVVLRESVLTRGTRLGDPQGSLRGDGEFEALREEVYVDARGGLTNLLEREWTYDLGAGGATSLFVRASTTGEAFVFQFSTDGRRFQDLLTVTGSASDGAYQRAHMPASIAGTVYVRARDADRGAGDGVRDTLFVDHLLLASSGAGSGRAPVRPSGLAATALPTGAIRLAWRNRAGQSRGALERSLDGLAWERIATLPAGRAFHLDESPAPATVHFYRVAALDAAGLSPWSDPAFGEPRPAAHAPSAEHPARRE